MRSLGSKEKLITHPGFPSLGMTFFKEFCYYGTCGVAMRVYGTQNYGLSFELVYVKGISVRVYQFYMWQ
jgi:hypothetical protein